MWCEVQQPPGEVLLRVMAVGLFALTIRHLIEATVARDDPNREGSRVRPFSRAGRRPPADIYRTTR